MASENKAQSASGGIGFAGILTIIFIVLKLNPGGHLTTGIVDWPWWEWWGVSVFCPIVWSLYVFVGVVGIILVVGMIAAIVAGLTNMPRR